MANQRSPYKKILTVWLQRTLFAKLEKTAFERGETLSNFVTTLITEATQHTALTSEEYGRIEAEVNEAQRISPSGR
jgi:macrodomain Ter protein organizer (MatP/YcbG family)